MLNKRLSELRIKNGKNQKQVAEELGLTYQRYNHYETGKRQPDNETLSLIAKYYGVTSDYILGLTDIPSPSAPMFSKILKKLRAEYKISQDELARYLSVSQQAVAKWETDKATPDPDTISRIADYFNVSSDYLLGRTDKREIDVVAFHKNTPGDFTDEEREEIENFIKYVISKREKK